MAQPSHGTSPWNLPNALTVLRILLVPVFGSMLLAQNGADAGQRFAALAVFVVAMITDRIDGDIARSRGLVTDVGKILDPIADKALLGMAFVGLSLIGLVPWWVTLLVLAREVGVTVVRFVVIRHGVMPAGRGGKIKTFAQAVALSLLILPAWVLPTRRSGSGRHTACWGSPSRSRW
jgi:CDP-diacylglycerol--glycerol-3-phosphate 3-phosphatidyltransferase